MNFNMEVQAFEIRCLKETLDRNDWNISKAAEDLCPLRTTLTEKIKKYCLRADPRYTERMEKLNVKT